MKYIRKPIEVDALPWTGDNFGHLFNFTYPTLITQVKEATLIVPVRQPNGPNGPNGPIMVYIELGDYIVKEPDGTVYPVKRTVFEQTYEAV
jgi:hypothetical protein